MFDRRSDTLLFVTCRNDDAQELKWLRIYLGEESSSQFGFATACSAISLRIDSRSRSGFHPNSSVARLLSMTTQGTSNARSEVSMSILRSPKRFRHQSVSCNRDIALFDPPPRLKTREPLRPEDSS